MGGFIALIIVLILLFAVLVFLLALAIVYAIKDSMSNIICNMTFDEMKKYVNAYRSGVIKRSLKFKLLYYTIQNDVEYQLWILKKLYPYYKDNDNEDNKDNEIYLYYKDNDNEDN